MATSGSADFSTTRDRIIKRALQIMGVLEAGEDPSAEDTQSCALALNTMVKEWMADGFKLWKIKQVIVFLSEDTEVYSLGDTGDHASVTTVKTELAAAASSGATSISVDSVS